MDTIELVRQPPVRSFNDADFILNNSTVLKEDSEEPEMLINLAVVIIHCCCNIE